jgi:hypothetical protein
MYSRDQNIMYKEWLVLLLSIIPGLGYWYIGKKKIAISIFLFIVLLVLIVLVSPIFIEFDYSIIIFLWYSQLCLVYQSVHLINKQFRDDYQLPRSPINSNNKITKTKTYEIPLKTQNWIEAQISSNDDLRLIFLGSYWDFMDNTILSKINIFHTNFYGGLTNKQLIIMLLDFTGIPIVMKKIDIYTIKKIRYTRGILTSKVIIDLKNEKNFELTISNRFQKITEDLINTLLGQE